MGRNGRMIWNLAEKLANSQGFYTRLFSRLAEFTAEDWEELEMELPDFKDEIDVIMYLEG